MYPVIKLQKAAVLTQEDTGQYAPKSHWKSSVLRVERTYSIYTVKVLEVTLASGDHERCHYSPNCLVLCSLPHFKINKDGIPTGKHLKAFPNKLFWFGECHSLNKAAAT